MEKTPEQDVPATKRAHPEADEPARPAGSLTKGSGECTTCQDPINLDDDVGCPDSVTKNCGRCSKYPCLSDKRGFGWSETDHANHQLRCDGWWVPTRADKECKGENTPCFHPKLRKSESHVYIPHCQCGVAFNGAWFCVKGKLRCGRKRQCRLKPGETKDPKGNRRLADLGPQVPAVPAASPSQ